MKKQIRTNRLYSRILTSVLIALMGIGIGISCSKDTGVSSTSPDSEPRATKPTLPDQNSSTFHPQTNVNYDPFAGMGLRERQKAIGGADAAEKFLQLIVAQIALAMNNQEARSVLHRVVPKIEQGEVHLTKVAAKYPNLLSGMSGGFKNALGNESMAGKLIQKATEASTDGEAILKVSEALFDLVLTLVVPPGMGWDDANAKIPVFYMPMDDKNATKMTGMDGNAKPVTYPFSKDDAPSAFLLLKFDESSSKFDDGHVQGYSLLPPQKPGMFSGFFNLFLPSSAYAHSTNYFHGPHVNLLQPVKEITIYNDHEGIGSPEIWVTFFIRVSNSVVVEESFDLADVDKVNRLYTQYAHCRTEHSTGPSNNYYIQKIRVWERDDGWHDDTVCEWGTIDGIYIRGPGTKTLYPHQASSNERDAKLKFRKTTEG